MIETVLKIYFHFSVPGEFGLVCSANVKRWVPGKVYAFPDLLFLKARKDETPTKQKKIYQKDVVVSLKLPVKIRES